MTKAYVIEELWTDSLENDPAAAKGYSPVAMTYNEEEAKRIVADAACLEWRRRGYEDNLLDYFKEKVQILYIFGDRTEPPPWLGDPDFHASHRSNLLRKDPLYYEQHGWTEPNDLPYVWPVKKETTK